MTRPARVRIDSAQLHSAHPAPARPRDDQAEPEPLYIRGLMRAQLRLALGCLLGFAATAAVIVLLPRLVPQLASVVWFAVPLPWLVRAYALYPVIVVFGIVYAWGASRNERRYLALTENDR